MGPPQRGLVCMTARVIERQLQGGEIMSTYVADGPWADFGQQHLKTDVESKHMDQRLQSMQ